MHCLQLDQVSTPRNGVAAAAFIRGILPERKRRRRAQSQDKTVSLHTYTQLLASTTSDCTQTAEATNGLSTSRYEKKGLMHKEREDLRPLHDIRHLSCRLLVGTLGMSGDCALWIHVLVCMNQQRSFSSQLAFPPLCSTEKVARWVGCLLPRP